MAIRISLPPSYDLYPLVSSSSRMVLGFLPSHSCFVAEVGAETGTFLIETEITPQ